MKNTTFLTALAVAVVALPLGACRSSKRVCRRSNQCAQAPMARNMPTPDAVTTPYSPPAMADAYGGDAYGGAMLSEQQASPMMPAPMMPAPMADGSYVDPGFVDQGYVEQGYVDQGMPTMPPVAGNHDLDAARAELEALRVQRSTLSDEAALAAQRADEAERALLETPPAPAPSMANLSGSTASGPGMTSMEAELRSKAHGEVVRDGSTVILRISDAFESGRDSLKRDSRLESTLRAMASTLRSNPDARVSVVGHSDSTPIVKTKHLWRSNHHLSEARAQRVADVLAQAGVNRSQIVSVVGRGASEPLVPERTRADRARNRRVEILISGS